MKIKNIAQYEDTDSELAKYTIITLEQEIERLNNQIEEYHKALDETTSEKIDLENIIKEVREYIETKEKDDDNWVDYELLIEPIKIKEILDKESI